MDVGGGGKTGRNFGVGRKVSVIKGGFVGQRGGRGLTLARVKTSVGWTAGWGGVFASCCFDVLIETSMRKKAQYSEGGRQWRNQLGVGGKRKKTGTTKSNRAMAEGGGGIQSS